MNLHRIGRLFRSMRLSRAADRAGAAFFLFAALLAAAFAGCSDDPGQVGRGLVSPNDLLNVDSVVVRATGDTTFYFRSIGTGGALVGQYQGMEAWSVIQHTGLTAIGATAIVDSGVIEIPFNYFLPDSTGTLGIDIHEMLRTWDATKLTFDSLSNTALGWYNTARDTSVLVDIAPGDTVIRIHIDHLARTWITARTDAPKGIVLKPNLISSTLIAGAHAITGVETRPRLIIYHRDAADTTVATKFWSAQRMFLGNGTRPTSPGSLVVQAGVSYRGIVRFDSLAMPAKASIVQAFVELPLDVASSLQSARTRDSLVVYLLRKTVYPFDSTAFAILCPPVVSGGQKTYRANVTPIVQQWIAREPNHGFLIRPLADLASFDRFALWGHDASPALRPKLIVTYTVFR